MDDLDFEIDLFAGMVRGITSHTHVHGGLITIEELTENTATSSPLPAASTPIHH